jgi:MAD (mothers against decapentaplegic) interacting protein
MINLFLGYPCIPFSDRHRKSSYGDIGHTIMNLLCDTRNFQYTLPQIDGLQVQMNGLHTKIIIPESQYDLILKSLLTSNDYVFCLASLEFDDSCSSSLVAIENENLGSYSNKTFFYKNDELAKEISSSFPLQINEKST